MIVFIGFKQIDQYLKVKKSHSRMLFKRQWNIHLTYYDEIKDQLYDTKKDDISKAEDISVEVDEDKNPLEDKDEVLVIL